MCNHANDQVCLHSPRLVRAALLRSEFDWFLDFEYSGDLPCMGTVILGIEMVMGDRTDVRHCCIEFQDGAPVGALTYDFRGHWQVNHDAAGLTARDKFVRGRFPSWSFHDRMPGEPFSAFAMQNGAMTDCGVFVSEGRLIGGDRSDRLNMEAC